MRWFQTLCVKKSFSLSVILNLNYAFEGFSFISVSLPPLRPTNHNSLFCDVIANSKWCSYCKKKKQPPFKRKSVCESQFKFNQGTFQVHGAPVDSCCASGSHTAQPLTRAERSRVTASVCSTLIVPVTRPLRCLTSGKEKWKGGKKTLKKYKNGNAKDKGKSRGSDSQLSTSPVAYPAWGQAYKA